MSEETKNIYISVDAGKDTTKACTKDKNGEFIKESFRSRTYNITEHGLRDAAGNTNKVIYNGTEYLIGDSGTDQSYSTDKVDEFNRLCQYVAITKFLEPGIDYEVTLVTGFPAARYKDEAQRNKYVSNLKGRVSITVNSKNYAYTITDVKVRPEGAGITVVKPELFAGKDVVVVDIGGQNLNISLFENLIPSDLAVTENAGGTNIEQSIRNTLTARGVENLTESVTRDIIKTGEVKGYDDKELNKSAINEINRYIQNKIVDTLDKNNINTTITDVVFVGGTSYILKDYLSEHFTKATFMDNLEESQFANCKGFYILGDVNE